MFQLVHSFPRSASRALAALIATPVIALVFSGSAAAQCAAMTHTAHSPGYGTTVTSLIAPPLSVTFNYAVNQASLNVDVNSGNVRLYEYNSGVKVPITATVSGNTIQIRPKAALKPSTLYRYYVSPGITGTAAGCGTMTYNLSHGNNWYTAAQCGTTEDFINNTVTLQPACKYDISFQEGYYLNVNADALTRKSTVGVFTYSRGADTALQGMPYANFVPDMYDFGLAFSMTDVTYNAAQNKWYAGTVTVTGYNDNGVGAQPTLNTYTNVPVASGSGPLTLTRQMTNRTWDPNCGCSVLHDISANYQGAYAAGKAAAKP